MMKYILIAALVLGLGVFFGYRKYGHQEEVHVVPKTLRALPKTPPKLKAVQRPKENFEFKGFGPATTVQAHIYGGYSYQRSRLLRISERVQWIINSDLFKKLVLENKYAGRPGFFDSKESPQLVYKTMLESDEFGLGKPDKVWQYELYIQVLGKGVLGEMYWPKPPIYFNSMYLDTRDSAGIAGTFCHEKSHQLGYDHSFEFTSNRQYSVPYTLGTICAKAYSTFYPRD